MPLSSVAQPGIRQSPQRQNLPCFGRDARMHGTTTFGNVFFFNGNRETSISLIDTVGFDDPERDADATINLTM